MERYFGEREGRGREEASIKGIKGLMVAVTAEWAPGGAGDLSITGYTSLR